ncbi:MAG TPA: Gfo/Idh/MocA family oxidoreductase [Pirellulales bacterium]|jgi:predicted dehydrogenase|nr:Gfo/Idh/MocA family oxidoreductase [Pirellulales bacterium]
MADGKPLGIALLGCGFATSIHARRLRKFPDVRMYFASRDRAKADAFAQKYAGAGSFAGYDTAIADDRVDAVVIATPPNSHLELALAALAAGKHCVIEKPPLVRAADFDTVLAAKERAGRRVLVAENYFYKPLAVCLREVLASGTLGEVRILSINALKAQKASGWRGDPATSGGGALFEGGIHWVDFMANLGLEVSGVQGFRPGADRTGPDRSMLVVFTYATGAVGTLYYSWETPGLLKGLRLSAIYGSRRTATFESNGLFLAVPGWPPRLYGASRDIAGYAAMWRDFVPALAENREPAFSFDRARRDLLLTEAIYASLRG